MSNKLKFSVTLPKIPNIELIALEGLERISKFIDVDETKIGEAKILVTEAIINAFEHAGMNNPIVKVDIKFDTDKIEIYVRDFGVGFNPDLIENPDISKKLHSNYKRGWGLKLMKSISDDFKIKSSSKGTKIIMIKNLK